MIVVILAGTVREAREYARIGQLATSDVLIPSSARYAEGLRLEDADLVVEFASFATHPHAAEIREELEHCIARTPGPPPVWERITG